MDFRFREGTLEIPLIPLLAMLERSEEIKKLISILIKQDSYWGITRDYFTNEILIEFFIENKNTEIIIESQGNCHNNCFYNLRKNTIHYPQKRKPVDTDNPLVPYILFLEKTFSEFFE